MPVLKKTFNFQITDEEDKIVTYRDYKNNDTKLVCLSKITKKFLEQLESMLRPTSLDATFDYDKCRMTIFGMEFLLVCGQTYNKDGIVNIHPFAACLGDISIDTSISLCHIGYNSGFANVAGEAGTYSQIGPKGNMLDSDDYSSFDAYSTYFSNYNTSDYVHSAQLSLSKSLETFPKDYKYQIIIYYNTNYIVIQYESAYDEIIPVMTLVKGRTYNGLDVLLMSYDINNNGIISNSVNKSTNQYATYSYMTFNHSKCTIRVIGVQYPNFILNQDGPLQMLPGIPRDRELKMDTSGNDALLHSGTVRHFRGDNHHTSNYWEKARNMMFDGFRDCKGVFTKINFDYSEDELELLGLNGTGKIIMCPPVCMGGLITFENMWCVPETTSKNKLLSISGSQYIVPTSTIRHQFPKYALSYCDASYNNYQKFDDQFYIFKL